MPWRARPPCLWQGCPNLQPCPLHQTGPHQYGRLHRAWRAMVLARDKRCQWPGCLEPATEADHIRSVRAGGARYSLDNGQGLCKRHHSAKTVSDGRFIGR